MPYTIDVDGINPDVDVSPTNDPQYYYSYEASEDVIVRAIKTVLELHIDEVNELIWDYAEYDRSERKAEAAIDALEWGDER